MINFSIPDLMVTIAGMAMIGLPAKTVVDEMSSNDQRHGRQQQPEMVRVKQLF